MKAVIEKYRAILLLLLLTGQACYGESFYDERYRGWLWFEDGEDREEEKRRREITPAEAREEMEGLKTELEDLRSVMLARPGIETVKAYRIKEQEMFARGEKLAKSWLLANLKYPELFDHIKDPVNVYTVKLKRELERKENEEKIREFAKEFELVLFFRGDCRYCEEFNPVLKRFSDKYGFKVEAVSIDGKKHELFRTMNVPELVKKLGVEATPTVVAVSETTAFELIRGYVTMTELEEYSLLAIKYLALTAEEKTYGKHK